MTSSSGINEPAVVYTFRWLLAWGIVLLLLSLFNRTRLGHTIIYYSLWLMLTFLIVTQYSFFARALAPIASPAQEPQTAAAPGATSRPAASSSSSSTAAAPEAPSTANSFLGGLLDGIRRGLLGPFGLA